MFLIGFYADDTPVGHAYYGVGIGSETFVVSNYYKSRAKFVAKLEE